MEKGPRPRVSLWRSLDGVSNLESLDLKVADRKPRSMVPIGDGSLDLRGVGC